MLLGTMSEAYPHLIFHNFKSRLGERTMSILKYLFPVPKEESRFNFYPNNMLFFAFTPELTYWSKEKAWVFNLVHSIKTCTYCLFNSLFYLWLEMFRFLATLWFNVISVTFYKYSATIIIHAKYQISAFFVVKKRITRSVLLS